MERKPKSLTFKGGKGNPAPYDSMMIRIPAPIKPLVQFMSESFRRYALKNNLQSADCYGFIKTIELAAEEAAKDPDGNIREKEKRLILENRVAYLQREKKLLENQVACLEQEKADLEDRLREFLLDSSIPSTNR